MDGTLTQDVVTANDLEEHVIISSGAQSHAVAIKAPDTNAGVVTVGAKTRSGPTHGFPLGPGEGVTLDLKNAQQMFYTLGVKNDKLAWIMVAA